jgi:RNA polymerase II-associated protein 1
MASPLLIFDVKEKETAAPQAPSFPQIKSSGTGFPEHKKRNRISAFKQKRQGTPASDAGLHTAAAPTASTAARHGAQTAAGGGAGPGAALTGKQSIDRENSQKMASMSTAEIEEARQELFNDLDPKILEMLLKRANLDEANGTSPFEEQTPAPVPTIQIGDETEPAISPKSAGNYKKVHFEEVDDDTETEVVGSQPTADEVDDMPMPTPDAGDAEPPSMPHDHDHDDAELPPLKPHWPHAPATPDLDPSDPNFLASLHEKYFPTLPADPSKLAWMAPIPTANSPADYDSPYHPRHSTIPVSQLRFDFRGVLLPPRIARAVPVTRGLHHHGEAPEAAGYTIRELARLARSAVPGQRCIAYQTLGRILFRLGHGNYGKRGDPIPDGIWNAIVEGKVLESLYEEADMDLNAPVKDQAGSSAAEDGDARGGRGHRSAHAFAVEAIWLFEKGGWADLIRKGR